MKIFNLFRRKKEGSDYHYCSNLMYLKDNQIRFQYTDLQRYIENVMKSLNIFEESLVINLYRDYKKYYTVYDRCPTLLKYRVVYFLKDLIKDQERLHSAIPHELSILNKVDNPVLDLFEIPDSLYSILKSIWARCTPYIAEGVDFSYYFTMIRLLYIKEWPIYIHKDPIVQEYLGEFYLTSLTLLISLGKDDDSKTCIKNIVKRSIEELKNESHGND